MGRSWSTLREHKESKATVSFFECIICVCIPDGLFGQCQSSKQGQIQYQVTVPVLKRMQEVLKQLMLQGKADHKKHQ